ncbi:hypothetical protein Cycma_0220 [Cyclobacterium marinum DSM 745]|uniref:Uncharacterized protein n=1 Tax=Cyclobacterium marinum (strain ATCC 25205 / DSM 745 / LMG 13164 / NCIMB 1802) TaxID=880070 RepID=G0J1Z6_CYCMS|nr:hypothetical protein Cycma_0220 [Cyclobacterium marinum DSM 745]
MKYFISLIKYIVAIVLSISLILLLKLSLPEAHLELTYNQALSAFIFGVILMAIGLKLSFDMRE